jgi:hypothetical protein
MLNQLEQAVLNRFFESEGLEKGHCDMSQIRITDRDFTGAGFVTWLKPNQLIVENGPSSFTGGRIGARLNGNLEAGFVVYIKEGYIHALEGYTYGEEWPEEIKSFDLYLVESP